MLILNRKVNEDLYILLPDGRPVVVKVVAIRDRDKARIGVSAPADVVVHRHEIFEKIQEEKAAGLPPRDGRRTKPPLTGGC